jgi:uncharacterized protein YkwD
MRKLVALALAVTGIGVSWLAAPNADNPHEACFRLRTNMERTERGGRPLGENARLDEIASQHSYEMAQDDTIYHNEELASELPSYEYAGENVGMGPDCEPIHQAFMASRPHRENILESLFTQFGVGVVYQDRTVYVTEIFFTPRASEPTPSPSPFPSPKRSLCPCR